MINQHVSYSRSGVSSTPVGGRDELPKAAHRTQREDGAHPSTTDPDAKLSCLGHTLGSDTAGRFHARVRGSSSGDGADGGCVAQFGEWEAVRAGAEQLKLLREKRWDPIGILGPLPCEPLWNLLFCTGFLNHRRFN